MTEMQYCPYRVCRAGLWYIVKAGCTGMIRYDPVNGDPKVWFFECRKCGAQADPKIIKEESEDGSVCR